MTDGQSDRQTEICVYLICEVLWPGAQGAAGRAVWCDRQTVTDGRTDRVTDRVTDGHSDRQTE